MLRGPAAPAKLPSMTNPVQQATIIQRRAARPGTSVALRASAGSGKTKVLVDRFVRLCVEDGPARAHPGGQDPLPPLRRSAGGGRP